VENRSEELASLFLVMLIVALIEAVFGAHERIDDLEGEVYGG
jgi:hypothetical protein